MSQSQSSAVEWHEFHNDPTSDIHLKSSDGFHLGASRHRLRGLSPVLDDMFSLPKSASREKREIEEVDMDHGSEVLAAVLTFANCPVHQASKLMVAHLYFEDCRQLLGFLRVFECPEPLWDITLSQWCDRASKHKDRVSIAHAVASWGWAGGLNKALSALDFLDVYKDSSIFWSFIDGFPEVQQKQLLRTIIRVDDGFVTLPSKLRDIATADLPKKASLPGTKKSGKPVGVPKKKIRM